MALEMKDPTDLASSQISNHSEKQMISQNVANRNSVTRIRAEPGMQSQKLSALPITVRWLQPGGPSVVTLTQMNRGENNEL